jgi:hypothetical protein
MQQPVIKVVGRRRPGHHALRQLDELNAFI